MIRVIVDIQNYYFNVCLKADDLKNKAMAKVNGQNLSKNCKS